MTIVDPEVVEFRRAVVVQLTREGWSAAQIGQRLGITDRSVLRHRAKAGVSLTGPATPLSADELEWVRELLADGCSRNEAARTVGRATSTIARYFPDSGWSREQTNAYLAALRRAKVQLRAWEGVFIK